jgi:uracil-DNA glycosylase
MTTQREPAYVIDPRARAMLAEMGVRVWMPADGAQAMQPQAKLGAAVPTSTLTFNQAPVTVAVTVRREPPLRLPVMDAPPSSRSSGSSAAAASGASDALTPAQYVIANLPIDVSDYDLVLLGEPCQGTAEQLLGNILKLFTSTSSMTSVSSISSISSISAAAPRIFIAHMVASHNEAVSLHDQLASLPAKLVLALGPHAAKALLGSAAEGIPFSKLRGKVHSMASDTATPHKVVVTYHPQQLLRQNAAKAMSWQDIRLSLRTLRQS